MSITSTPSTMLPLDSSRYSLQSPRHSTSHESVSIRAPGNRHHRPPMPIIPSLPCCAIVVRLRTAVSAAH